MIVGNLTVSCEGLHDEHPHLILFLRQGYLQFRKWTKLSDSLINLFLRVGNSHFPDFGSQTFSVIVSSGSKGTGLLLILGIWIHTSIIEVSHSVSSQRTQINQPNHHTHHIALEVIGSNLKEKLWGWIHRRFEISETLLYLAPRIFIVLLLHEPTNLLTEPWTSQRTLGFNRRTRKIFGECFIYLWTLPYKNPRRQITNLLSRVNQIKETIQDRL